MVGSCWVKLGGLHFIALDVFCWKGSAEARNLVLLLFHFVEGMSDQSDAGLWRGGWWGGVMFGDSRWRFGF